jgi:hypothetical protein
MAEPNTLQIGNGNRWRFLLQFDPARRPEIEDAAASLSRAAGGLRLRIVDAEGNVRHLNAYGAFRTTGGINS